MTLVPVTSLPTQLPGLDEGLEEHSGVGKELRGILGGPGQVFCRDIRGLAMARVYLFDSQTIQPPHGLHVVAHAA